MTYLQAKEPQRLPGNHQKPEHEKHGTDSPSKPSERTNPANTLILNFQPPRLYDLSHSEALHWSSPRSPNTGIVYILETLTELFSSFIEPLIHSFRHYTFIKDSFVRSCGHRSEPETPPSWDLQHREGDKQNDKYTGNRMRGADLRHEEKQSGEPQ